MKNLLRYFSLLAAVFFLSQCGIQRVGINTYRPAEITFPSYVQTLLIVDRTEYQNKKAGILEGILTGELPGEDRSGVQAAMSALQTTLMASPRFKVKTASESLFGNSFTSAFPEPIEWPRIQELCSRYGAEGIVAMEIFNSNFIPTSGTRTVKKTITDDKGQKKEVDQVEFYAQGVSTIKIGIRLYDPKARSIVDQQLLSQTKTWEATANSAASAIAQLIVKGEATRQLGAQAGMVYANKIAPMPMVISRDYYGKSKKSADLETGARQAQVNDWKGAIATWENAVATSEPKVAGKLCYDIAVGYEALADLDNAKKWAGKAWVDYHNGKARQYSQMLEARTRQNELLEEQMKKGVQKGLSI